MNYLDTYDISGESTANQPPPPAQQSLNEEVNEVLGSISSFWGGFTKQSTAALASARKLDFAQVVTQAQAEFTKHTTTEQADASRSLDTTTGEDASAAAAGPSTLPSSSDADDPTTPTAPRPSSLPDPTSTTLQSLFSRLQSAIPPNVVSAVQHNIPDSLTAQAGSLDIAALRETVTREFGRVQGVTRAQAEEYMKRSEGFLKEAQVVLSDAVKVIPPEQQAGQPGFTWDGTDMWMLPTDTAAAATGDAGKGKGKEKAESVATRAEALLKRLRTDPEIIAHELDDSDSSAGSPGSVGSEAWKSRIEKELGDGSDGQALGATKDALVPSKMTEEEFWRRYFYRVHQIQTEEEKRKALIQGSIATDDDFSWEDDESDTSESTPALQNKTSTTTLQPPKATEKSIAVPPGSTSPTQSSDASFDVVGANSGTASAAENKKGDSSSEEGSSDEEESGEEESEEESGSGSDWE